MDGASYGGVIFKSKELFAGDKSVGVKSADAVELGDTSGEPDKFAASLFNDRAGCWVNGAGELRLSARKSCSTC